MPGALSGNWRDSEGQSLGRIWLKEMSASFFGLLLVHGSEARGFRPGAAMMNGDPVDPAAELVNLRRGYQELLTRANGIERGHAQRLDELSTAYVKSARGPTTWVPQGNL